MNVAQLLEEIDRLRIPLAEKRIERETMSEEEEICLHVLDDVTEDLLTYQQMLNRNANPGP